MPRFVGEAGGRPGFVALQLQSAWAVVTPRSAHIAPGVTIAAVATRDRSFAFRLGTAPPRAAATSIEMRAGSTSPGALSSRSPLAARVLVLGCLVG